jgi:RNA polymerase sigma-70 factor (ECF subfamily)
MGSLGVYLYGIARNLLRRRFRTRVVHPEVEIERLAEGALPAPASEDVLDRLERSQALASLRRAISSLPTHYRETIVLCELHEMSYEEAALVIGCPIGTIRSRLSRARRLLAQRCVPDAASSARDRGTCSVPSLSGLRRV